MVLRCCIRVKVFKIDLRLVLTIKNKLREMTHIECNKVK